VEIIVDTAPLTRYLGDFEQRQVPYALSNTLNDVAKLFQYRERQHIGQQFTVRRKQWVDNSVKITEFATKRKLQATVAIESPGGGKRSDILGKFESQTQKRPISGGSIAIPADAKRNKHDIILKSARPKAFNFREVIGPKHVSPLKANVRSGVLRGHLKVFEGDKRTVMIKNAQGQGVILQRVGRGKRAGMRLLYTLAPKVRISPDLHFVLNARQAVTHVGEFFAARFREAMASAR
jgi:hypothetical protein